MSSRSYVQLTYVPCIPPRAQPRCSETLSWRFLPYLVSLAFSQIWLT